ncbi:uncharacterized protein B0I36DRAFT_329001 [Microdochium trichocladiopsis]|uniref:Uncharacterized protein n=1 Tax=Microdochium trichocladiopsis TaxID=1682393 RepID=A0A9P8XYY2_9PEZI|nr:uncharacterized protein B0I36DRAFT_329001 [Microdochium trichocladiopsis]KAH7025729.1 hypothetical protein B0I36DRAFT_329001 [Microdochium trichocladiopsis]
MATKRWEATRKAPISSAASIVSEETTTRSDENLALPIVAAEGRHPAPVTTRKPRSGADRPLVSMPNLPIPIHPADVPSPNQAQKKATAVEPPPLYVQPRTPRPEPLKVMPVTKLRLKPASSRPPVSVPICPVPRPWDEMSPPKPTAISIFPASPPGARQLYVEEEQAPVMDQLPTIEQSPTGRGTSAVDSRPAMEPVLIIEQAKATICADIRFSCSADIEVAVGGELKTTRVQIVLGYKQSMDVVGSLVLTQESIIIFQAEATAFSVLRIYGDALLLRYQLPHEKTDATQLRFENSNVAQKFADALEDLKEGRQPTPVVDLAGSEAHTATALAQQAPELAPVVSTVMEPKGPEIVADLIDLENDDSTKVEHPATSPHSDKIVAHGQKQETLLDVPVKETAVFEQEVETPAGQRVLEIMSSISEADYEGLIATWQRLRPLMADIQLEGTSLEERTAVQASLMHLMRRQEFHALPLEEQKRARDIWSRRLLQGRARVVRSRQSMELLRKR